MRPSSPTTPRCARSTKLVLNAFSTFSQMVMVHIGLREATSVGWTRDLTRAQQRALGVRLAFWRSLRPQTPVGVRPVRNAADAAGRRAAFTPDLSVGATRGLLAAFTRDLFG